VNFRKSTCLISKTESRPGVDNSLRHRSLVVGGVSGACRPIRDCVVGDCPTIVTFTMSKENDEP